MSDRIHIEGVNIAQVRDAMAQAPVMSFRILKSEFSRFAKRFRKKFIKERMSGRPGITWRDKQTIGKNVRSAAAGANLLSLKYTARISRFLRVHEEGGRIVPKQAGGWLYLIKRSRSGQRTIVGRVKQVVIPARLGFQDMAEREIKTDLIPRIHAGLERAMKITFQQRVGAVTRLLGKVAA